MKDVKRERQLIYMDELSSLSIIDNKHNKIIFSDPDTLTIRVVMYRDFLYVLCYIILLFK